MKVYNKLIRDKIPEIIEQKGEKADVYIADDLEYRSKLREKLQEEIEEFLDVESIEELADIQEVIYAFIPILSSSKAELERIRKDKKNTRGGFSKKLILKSVE